MNYEAQCNGTTTKGNRCKMDAFKDPDQLCRIHRPGSKKTPKQQKRHEAQLAKDAQTLSLRLSGASYSQIADVQGYAGPGPAYDAFKRALDRVVFEEPDTLRSLELSRLDAVQIETFRSAQQGNVGAIDRLIKIMQHRARLTGIEAPEKIEHTGTFMPPVTEVIIGPVPDDD